MSNLVQNENLIDYLGGGRADDSHTSEAIETLPLYANFARLDPFAGSMIFAACRFRVKSHGRIGWVIPVETAGIVRAFDGSHQIGVRCNVPGKMRDSRGKLVSRVVVAVGDLDPSSASRHRKPFAIPCAVGETQWAADAKSERTIERIEKRAAAHTGEDTATKADAIAPFSIEQEPDCDPDLPTFGGKFNPAAGLASAGIDLPGGLDLPSALAWEAAQNAEAQRILAKFGAAI